MKRVKVLIIEDSPSVREILIHIISQDPRLQVVEAVPSAEKGLALLKTLKPDVISLDIRLPGINGFEATSRIMSDYPVPIVVIASDVRDDDLMISMNALRAGALSVVEKPVGFTHADYIKHAQNICEQLIAMSTVKVVRQRFPRLTDKGKKQVHPRLDSRKFKILALVASTGGPSAVLQILQALPEAFPIPIVLVQHITNSFLQSFAEWLGSNTKFKIQIAYTGEIPRPGVVYLAPPDHHLEVRANHLALSRDPPELAQRPSGNILLRSVAKSYGSSAIGIILTGMGNDGADGLLDMKEAGAHTIAEDESTAVVYGMPAVAANIGAACEILPLDNIAPQIVQLLKDKGNS